jgi:hypothetical protein
MGYDFAQAVADLIDNSIEAQAHTVWINAEFEAEDSWISVADDGQGMTPDMLREALRYGAEREYDVEDLGKFGLGLKVASLSQCQRLTVASRVGTGRARITAYTWDFDHIEKTNRWEILPVSIESLPKAIQGRLQETRGTIVFWQRLDRILGCKHPYGEVAKKRFAQMSRELEIHLGMVFHRFLAGEVRGRELRIILNDENEVRPWDPFCRGERATIRLKPSRILVQGGDLSGEVYLQPYILPVEDSFSSQEAFKDASGPAKWNQQQGFYIYRANRMIQGGGWCHFRSPDEHTKLARIALDFSRDLDEAFKLNVPKMRVILPPQIREEVDEIIGPVVKLARKVYDKGERGSRPPPRDSAVPPPVVAPLFVSPPSGTVTAGVQDPAGSSSPGPSPSSRSGTGSDDELLTFDQWIDRVLSAAATSDRLVLSSIFEKIRASLSSSNGHDRAGEASA